MVKLPSLPFLSSPSGAARRGEGGAERETPLGNTGSNRQNGTQLDTFPSVASSDRFTSKIHWLQGTFNFHEPYIIKLIIERFKDIFPTDAFYASHPIYRGKMRYSHSFMSTNKIIIAYNEPTSDLPGFGWLSIPGGAFDSLHGEEFIDRYSLLCFLLQDEDTIICNWRTTQIHLNLNDYHKKITPELCFQAALDRNFSGFRKLPSTHSSFWEDSSGNVHCGMSVCFGGKGSDKKVIIYNKFVESRGVDDCIRIEVKYCDESAHMTFIKLIETLQSSDYSCFFHHIARIVCGSISFIDRSSDNDSHLNRKTFLPWWEDIVSSIGVVSYPVFRKKSVLSNTVEWVASGVETTLAIFHDFLGAEKAFDFYIQLVTSGLTRLTPEHKAKIRTATAENFDLIAYYNLIKNLVVC